MQYALIRVEDDRLEALSDLESPEDWIYPDTLYYLVEASEFFLLPESELADYQYVDGQFVYDEDAPAEREAKRQLEPGEVLTAMFKVQPETMAALSDESLSHMASYMAEWELGTGYLIGDMQQYQEYPYRCVQAHTAQVGYEPDVAVSLWARILPGQDGEIGEWVQPDSTNPYMKGDRVRHNGKVWESIYDNNVYEPGVAGWEEVSE